MKKVVPLEEAQDAAVFGSKAVGLGQAIRHGLPVPRGFALSGSIVEAVAAGEQRAINEASKCVKPLGGPLAVRSSAVDEDSAEASFAGQHLTLLNVPSSEELSSALSEIWWSANSELGNHVQEARRPLHSPQHWSGRPVAPQSRDCRGDVHQKSGHPGRRAGD